MTGTTHEEIERPCAAHGLISYRCRGRYDWVWIGATDHVDALKQARRSCEVAQESDLQIWNGVRYVDVYTQPSGQQVVVTRRQGESGRSSHA